jgi:hypothetical protein
VTFCRKAKEWTLEHASGSSFDTLMVTGATVTVNAKGGDGMDTTENNVSKKSELVSKIALKDTSRQPEERKRTLKRRKTVEE